MGGVGVAPLRVILPKSKQQITNTVFRNNLKILTGLLGLSVETRSPET